MLNRRRKPGPKTGDSLRVSWFPATETGDSLRVSWFPATENRGQPKRFLVSAGPYNVRVTLVSVRGRSGSSPFTAARLAAKICAGTM